MAESAANFAMQQGQVDAVFRVRAPGNRSIRNMIGDQKLHLVPIAQSEALALKQPAIEPGVIPLGSYRGSPAIPAHAGARSYLDREKPGFVQQNARLASTTLYVGAIVFSALLALRTHWVRSRRKRMHVFNQQLMKIASAMRDTSDESNLLDSKNQLIDILTQVIRDLERERVSQAEFEQFSFTWHAVDALLRDRLSVLQTVSPQNSTTKASAWSLS